MVTIVAGLVLATVSWKEDSILLVSHRAAKYVAPENTVAAMYWAFRQGADAVEIDVRRTRDGHLVLFHDDWVLPDYGPGTRIEDLDLAEVKAIDLGARWGAKGRGSRVPLLEEALRFAGNVGLYLFIDVKTLGIEGEIWHLIDRMGVRPQTMSVSPGIRVDATPAVPPWISGYRWSDGGDEHPLHAREVLTGKSGPYRIMVGDSRSWSMALFRQVARRGAPVEPPSAARPLASAGVPRLEDLESADSLVRRRALRSLSRNWVPDLGVRVLELAKTDADDRVRLEAIVALGSEPSGRFLSTIREWVRAKGPPTEPKPTMDHYPVFWVTAVACALARCASPDAREALAELESSGVPFGREAIAVALSAYGTTDDLPALERFVSPSSDEGVASFALSHLARFGPSAAPVWLRALERRGDTRRAAVYALAELGPAVIDDLVSLAARHPRSWVREGAALSLYWMSGDEAAKARADLLSRTDDADVQTVLRLPRTWETVIDRRSRRSTGEIIGTIFQKS